MVVAGGSFADLESEERSLSDVRPVGLRKGARDHASVRVRAPRLPSTPRVSHSRNQLSCIEISMLPSSNPKPRRWRT